MCRVPNSEIPRKMGYRERLSLAKVARKWDERNKDGDLRSSLLKAPAKWRLDYRALWGSSMPETIILSSAGAPRTRLRFRNKCSIKWNPFQWSVTFPLLGRMMVLPRALLDPLPVRPFIFVPMSSIFMRSRPIITFGATGDSAFNSEMGFRVWMRAFLATLILFKLENDTAATERPRVAKSPATILSLIRREVERKPEFLSEQMKWSQRKSWD